MKIQKISWEQTIPIRHEVLWPNEEPAYCKVEGDEDALHFGVYAHGQLSCVASIYTQDKSARLRKFATLEKAQGKGIGSFMIVYLIRELKNNNVDYLWFDARESAIEFYRRFGFEVEGGRFYKKDVPYFKMHQYL